MVQTECNPEASPPFFVTDCKFSMGKSSPALSVSVVGMRLTLLSRGWHGVGLASQSFPAPWLPLWVLDSSRFVKLRSQGVAALTRKVSSFAVLVG